ncbi:RHS repeat domain-containing protein [Empedobacter brevis]
MIDDLVYDYENTDKSNKLQKVTDSSNTLGFNDGNKTGNDYTYDVNGNLKTDLNKGIEIDYNHLNLPTLVKKGTQTIEYAYSATGVKLRKIVKAQQGVNAGLTTTTTEYLDGFQYKDGVLQFFPTTEGYVNAITAGSVAYNYVYNLTDHLGNVRVSYAWDDVNSKLKTVNEDHYYPFGLQHKGYNKPPADITIRDTERIEIGVGIGSNSGSTNYKYKYNGKELQEELGLNIYDYGARNYDPALGRWFNIDPASELMRRHSPYNYVANDPIGQSDFDGKDYRIDVIRDKNGDITGIYFSARIFIQGAGASDKRANELNNKFLNTYGGGTKVNGINIYINADYQYSPNKKQSELKQGENILSFSSDKSEGNENISFVRGNVGTIYGSGKKDNTIFHESFHLLGLSDRYDDFRECNGCGMLSGTTETHKGFNNDIMGNSSVTNLNKFHFKQWMEHAKFRAKGSTGKGAYFPGNLIESYWDKVSVDVNSNGNVKTPFEKQGYHTPHPLSKKAKQ